MTELAATEPHPVQARESDKPFKVNFADLPWQPYTKGRFGSDDKYLTADTRAKKLDCALTRLAPSQVSCPYHFHHVDEEMFIVLEGRGKVRMDNREVEVGPQDVVTCPPGPTGAHQFINDGTEPLIYLAISTESALDVCEYPDSDKLLVHIEGAAGTKKSRVFKRSGEVDYWDGELGS